MFIVRAVGQKHAARTISAQSLPEYLRLQSTHSGPCVTQFVVLHPPHGLFDHPKYIFRGFDSTLGG